MKSSEIIFWPPYHALRPFFFSTLPHNNSGTPIKWIKIITTSEIDCSFVTRKYFCQYCILCSMSDCHPHCSVLIPRHKISNMYHISDFQFVLTFLLLSVVFGTLKGCNGAFYENLEVVKTIFLLPERYLSGHLYGDLSGSSFWSLILLAKDRLGVPKQY